MAFFTWQRGVAVLAFLTLLGTRGAIAEGGARPQGVTDLGIIFNLNGLFQSIESYQGGLGVKIGFGGRSAVRALLNVSYSSSNGSFALEMGGAYEYHLTEGLVSPYVGVALSVGYLQQASSSIVVPVSAGPLIGVEVSILEFLSVFAEYGLTFSFTSVTDLVVSTTTSSFGIGTGLGNDAKIGIVVHLLKRAN